MRNNINIPKKFGTVGAECWSFEERCDELMTPGLVNLRLLDGVATNGDSVDFFVFVAIVGANLDGRI